MEIKEKTTRRLHLRSSPGAEGAETVVTRNRSSKKRNKPMKIDPQQANRMAQARYSARHYVSSVNASKIYELTTVTNSFRTISSGCAHFLLSLKVSRDQHLVADCSVGIN